MTPPTAVQTPFRRGEPQRVGRHLWRKQVLPRQSIFYRDKTGERQIDFDNDYFKMLQLSFKAGAFDQVPFLLDPGGREPHDNAAVQDFRGEVKGLEEDDKGIFALIETTPAGTKVLEENPRLGVSARVVEDYDRADGKHYPLAMAHVLGTLDPKVTGLEPWERVDLSTPEVTVIDLTAGRYPDEDAGREEGPVPGEKPWEPTDEQKAALEGLPGLTSRLTEFLDQGGSVDEEDDDLGGLDSLDLSDLDPEEAAFIQAALEGEDTDLDDDEGDLVGALAGGDEGEATNLAREAQAEIDLINSQRAADAQRIKALETNLAEAEWEKTAQDYAAKGVPTAILDLAKPFAMAEARTIDLAGTSQSFDVHDGIHRILHELEGTVDTTAEHTALSRPTDLAGSAEDRLYQSWVAQSSAGFENRKALDQLADA